MINQLQVQNKQLASVSLANTNTFEFSGKLISTEIQTHASVKGGNIGGLLVGGTLGFGAGYLFHENVNHPPDNTIEKVKK